MGSAHAPGAYTGRGNPGPRARWVLSGGSPSQCLQRLKKPPKGVIMAAPPLARCWTMMPCYFSTELPSHGAPCSCPFRLSFHSQELSSPWVCTPNPSFQHPAPLCNRRLMIQTGMHRAAVLIMPAVLTLPGLPQTVCCILL